MTEDERYITGFNHGYEMMNHDPDMAMIISKGIQQNEDSYAKAFIHGSLQAIKENEYSKAIENSKQKGEKDLGIEY